MMWPAPLILPPIERAKRIRGRSGITSRVEAHEVRTKMKTVLKILLPFLVLGVTGAVVALLVKNKQEFKPAPVVTVVPLVEVMEVTARPHQFVVRSQGEVAARTEIDLVSEVSGKIIWIAAQFADGGFFRAGEPLAKIDPRDFEVAVTQAEAAVAQGRVALERELAEASVARKDWDALGKGKANSLLLREPQLAQAEAGLRSALASLDRAKLELSRCEISAPFAGRIRGKQVDVGQFVNRGAPVARAYAVDYVEVRLPLPLDELGYLNLSLGQSEDTIRPAAVLSVQIGGRRHRWSGRLVRTAGEINAQTRMLTGIVRVEDPNGLGSATNGVPLPVGLFVEAEISGRTEPGILRAPRAAMRGPDSLMVVDTEDILRFRRIEVVRLLPEAVLIRSGLESGDRICISLLDAPVDGMKVRVRDASNENKPSAEGTARSDRQ